LGAQGIETAGGRVLGVTAGADDLRTAMECAYRAVGKIEFAGMHYRSDVGQKGVKRYGARTVNASVTPKGR
jgi:phosphoribosylamine--glycine ligase